MSNLKDNKANSELADHELDAVQGAGVVVHDVRKAGGHQQDGVMVPDAKGGPNDGVMVPERK